MGKPIKLNFAGVTDYSKPVPKDVYHVRVKKCEIATERKDGTKYDYPLVKGVLSVVSGEYAGRDLFMNLTTNPEETQGGSQKNFMLCGFLSAIGLAEAGQKDIEFDPDDALNCELLADVDIDSESQQNQFKKFMVME